MEAIEAREAAAILNALLDRIERGDKIVITRNGEPVARLVPISAAINRHEAQQASDRIRARARRLKLGAFDRQVLKADRDRGRP